MVHEQEDDVVFLIGSPRSGTTLLGEILGLHPAIGSWYEPSFILDRFFREAPHDRRTAQDATPKVIRFIHHEFKRFKQKRRCTIVVDKSPYNSLKLPFLNEIFSNAKFVHLVRDGRDVVLSMRREWQRRQAIAAGGLDRWPARVRAVWHSLQRQPLWEHRLQALHFLLGGPLGVVCPSRWWPYVRWEGKIGWGPRFPGWQDVINKVTLLEFCALQWRSCVETILTDSTQLHLGEDRLLEVRYEDVLRAPKATLKRLLAFLDLSPPPGWFEQLPHLHRHNMGKWRTALSREERQRIGPILQPWLERLGYASSGGWMHE